MAKPKAKENINDGDKIFTISLRNAYKKSERKRAPYAMRLLRKELARHTHATEIKLGTNLNEAVWARGMKKPLAKVRVKAFFDGTVLKAELVGHDYTDFKAKPKEEKKGAKEKLLERLGPKAVQKEKEEKLAEGKDTEEGKEARADKHNDTMERKPHTVKN